VEERHDLRLSRAIATPNIASKGKLESRSVVVPVYGIPQPQARSVHQVQPNGVSQTVTPSVGSKPLIEEIGGSSSSQRDVPSSTPSSKTPVWSITTLQNGQIRVDLEMPDLVSYSFFPIIAGHLRTSDSGTCTASCVRRGTAKNYL
jgi:hypothetical protein